MTDSSQLQTMFEPPEQPLLLEVEECWLYMKDEERCGRYTAARIREQDRVYRAVAVLLRDGHSIRQVARELGMAEKTVSGISNLEAARISAGRQGLSRDCLRVAARLKQRVEAEVDRMSGRDAVLGCKLMIDAGLSLVMGESGEKVPAKEGMSREEFAAWLRGAVPGAGPIIDVQEVQAVQHGPAPAGTRDAGATPRPPNGAPAPMRPIEPAPDVESGSANVIPAPNESCDASVAHLGTSCTQVLPLGSAEENAHREATPTSQAAGLETAGPPAPPPAPVAPDRAATGGGGLRAPAAPELPMEQPK